MKKIKTLFSMLVIIFFIVAVAYIMLLKSEVNKQKSEIATTDIEGVITDIGELATAEYGYTIVQTTDKPSKTVAGFEIPFTESKVIYSYEGLVKAGINFRDVEVTVNEVSKTIFVDIPEAEILSVKVDFDSLIVYDEKYSPFNKFTFSDMNLSLSDLKNTAEESAKSKGLLVRANENAQSIIGTTIRSFYDPEEYGLEFY